MRAHAVKSTSGKDEYVPFHPEDYVDNPVALARIKAGIAQSKLAKVMKVSQEYIGEIEAQDKVVAKVLIKVKSAIKAIL